MPTPKPAYLEYAALVQQAHAVRVEQKKFRELLRTASKPARLRYIRQVAMDPERALTFEQACEAESLRQQMRSDVEEVLQVSKLSLQAVPGQKTVTELMQREAQRCPCGDLDCKRHVLI